MPDPNVMFTPLLRAGLLARRGRLPLAALCTVVVALGCTDDPGFSSLVPPSSTPPSGVGGRVWFDGVLTAPDGVQGGFEPGLAGFEIVLADENDVVLDTRTTAIDGSYVFPELSAGLYQVGFVPPDPTLGWLATLPNQGSSDSLDSDPNPTFVFLDVGELDLTVDFGFYREVGTASVGDQVWHDLDLDGIQDPAEVPALGIGGVDVVLRDPLGNEIDRCETDGAGRYEFVGLKDGLFRLDLDATTIPPGFGPTLSDAGSDDSVDSDPQGAVFVLNGTDLTWDFGLRTPDLGSIGDLVWDDVNEDGCQQLGEPGLGGIRLTLQDDLGNDWVTVSLSDGSYVFSGLPAGNYTVDVDATTLPVGYQPTACNACGDPTVDNDCGPVAVVLAADQMDPTVDFGFAFSSPVQGSIGDRVWFDFDGDGIQDPEDVGLQGYGVELVDGFGNLSTDVTAADGSYRFDNLAAGAYFVQMDLTQLPAGFVPTACQVGGDPAVDSNCLPAVVILATSTSRDDSVDFGFRATSCSGAIGDRVWDDQDQDGIQDAGEPGLAGVKVTLRDSQGVDVGVTTTDANGNYAFFGRCADSYTVGVDESTLPANYVAAPCNVGSDDTLDNDCSPITIVLETDDEQETSVDFGFHLATLGGAIAGRVWNDKDLNGCEDPSEPGLELVCVGLRDDQGTIVQMVWTPQDGSYAFPNIPAGSYTVEVDTTTLPSDATPSPCDACGDDTTDSDCSPVAVSVQPGGAVTDLDFGYRSSCTGRVGDLIWRDINGNGLQDQNPPGISGVRLRLRNDQGVVIEEVLSNPQGKYLFQEVCGGTYTIEIDPATLPPGAVPAPCQVGSDPSFDSDCSPLTIFLPTDDERTKTYDFGFVW